MSSNRSNKSSRKGRPTFRPANQRKPRNPPTSVVTAAPPPPSEDVEEEASVLSNNQDTSNEQPPDSEDQDVSSNVTNDSSLAKAPRRSGGKKRKASTGVAIGVSRPVREHDEEVAQEDGTAVAQPSVVPEPDVPSALPGQNTLQAFCSKFRSKEKRQKQKENAAAEPVPDAAQAEAAVTSSGPVVQVINGEIVLQESSMVVPGARVPVQEVEEEFQHVVEEESHTAVVGASYHSFVSRRAPQHWTVEETKLFYHALRQVGTDFVTMASFFESRSRKQLKRKYQAENSKHPHLVALALDPKSKVPLDLSVFKVQVGASSSTDQPENTSRELEQSASSQTASSQTSLPPSQQPSPGQDMETHLEEIVDSFDEPPGEETLSNQAEETQDVELTLEGPKRTNTRRSKRPKFKASKTKFRAK